MAAAKKPKPRRLSKKPPKSEYGPGEHPNSQANLGKGRPPALPGHAHNGTTLVKSKQPQWLEDLDGTTFEQRRDWFHTLVVDAGSDALAFGGLELLTVTEMHHYLCCAPLVPHMSTNQERLHIRRGKFIRELLNDLGLTPMAQSKLGLRQAQEMAAKNQPVRPRRDREHLQQVANILDTLGLLPPAETVDAEVVESEGDPEPEVVSDNGPDYGGDTPEPLPEAARRDLGVRSIFDRGI